ELTEARVTIQARDADLPVDKLFRVELTGNRLEVAEQSEHGSFLQSVLGGDLRGIGRDRRIEFDIVIELPAGSTVKVGVGSADVSSTGRLGTTSVSSGSSKVALELVDGALQLRGGSGHAEVHQVTGSCHVRGGSGLVRIGEVGGALSVAVGSGEVAIGVAHGSVRVRSGSGSTVIEAAEQDVDVASSSGPVTIGLRPGQPARLDVATGSGRLNTEMPVQDSAPVGEAITIRARTGSGDVTVRRAATVAG
ncbi:MAG TPA: DUF4097 family beta strand repeat-containing protein, partial [Jatrophihabitans sp.]|nr:DUF4097 family beta strand repeat-containing protein [Jatrophihabitans sp.]